MKTLNHSKEWIAWKQIQFAKLIKYEGKINVYKLDNIISNKQKETNIVKKEWMNKQLTV